jgi:hypothetical protein
MFREYPVDGGDREFFLSSEIVRSLTTATTRPSSSVASLDRGESPGENAVPQLTKETASTFVTNVVHRFEESIAGRPYLIEVAAVSADRWRAYIVRVPGVPTALMPFYGRTPDEAAGLLTAWLSRAYQRAAGNAAR